MSSAWVLLGILFVGLVGEYSSTSSSFSVLTRCMLGAWLCVTNVENLWPLGARLLSTIAHVVDNRKWKCLQVPDVVLIQMLL